LKVFTIIQGIRIRRLLIIILRHGITPLPIYLLRFLVLLLGALASSALSLVEKLKFGRKIRETKLEQDPVFIIGHWRTGSTYLHQLLNLHPELTAPNMVQTAIPDHFLFSTPYYVPLLKKVLPKSRPMDRVALSPMEPQEEEFALLRMGAKSPLEKLLFPGTKSYFLKNYPDWMPRGKAGLKFKSRLLTLYKKIQLQTGLRILSKNPYHSMRIPMLREIFPEARFIHIVRDPMVVVPSTIRMWDIVARENALKRGWQKPRAGETVEVLLSFLEEVNKQKEYLAPGHFVEVHFEELEQHPEATLKNICERLELNYSPEFEKALRFHQENQEHYEKNSYRLSEEDSRAIQSALQSADGKYGYALPG